MMTIPHGLWVALQQYLLTQPMGEVEGLVNGLRQAKPADAPEETPRRGDAEPDEAKGP